MPLYLAAFLYDHYLNQKDHQGSGFLTLLGFMACLAYFNYPHIIYNLKNYLCYVEISDAYNLSSTNQPILQQWGVAQVRRGGWLWVWKYFLLIMPVVFPFYLVCVGYLVGRCFFLREGR